MMEEPTALVGVDWASAEHQVCALGPAGPVQRAFLHDAAGLGAMVDWLSTLADRPDLVAVAIETPHGPVVEALMDRGLAVYAINPKQLDRFRDRFSPAGAKDDRRDALVLASSLRTDRHCFRRLEVLDPTVVELREWSRMFDELKEERARLTNRIRQQLWRYYPQALELVDDPGSDWFLDVLALAPTPDTAGKLTEKKLGRVLNLHRIRKISATDALEVLKRPALTVAAGTTQAASAQIAAMAERVRLVNRQLKDATKRRPRKVPLLQHLVKEAEPLSIPPQELDPVSSPAAEAKDCSRGGRLSYDAFGQGRQPIDPAPHIRHPTGEINAHIPRRSDHVASTQAIKDDSILGSISAGAFSDRPLRSEISTTCAPVAARRGSPPRAPRSTPAPSMTCTGTNVIGASKAENVLRQ